MTPIFVLTCDRLECLRRALQSYKGIQTPFEVVFVDFGSTYPPTLQFLGEMEAKGNWVYRREAIINPNDLHQVNECIMDYFGTHGPCNYVITDPDVALEDVSGDVLDVMEFMLSNFMDIDVAGCMLRIDDIPDCYPYKEDILNGSKGLHKEFHNKTIHTVEYGGKNVQFIYAPIDSTFGMYRAGTAWGRCRRGIRLCKPYEARHLDWYVNPNNIPPDQAYYMEHASNNIAHWSKW